MDEEAGNSVNCGPNRTSCYCYCHPCWLRDDPPAAAWLPTGQGRAGEGGARRGKGGRGRGGGGGGGGGQGRAGEGRGREGKGGCRSHKQQRLMEQGPSMAAHLMRARQPNCSAEPWVPL